MTEPADVRYARERITDWESGERARRDAEQAERNRLYMEAWQAKHIGRLFHVEESGHQYDDTFSFEFTARLVSGEKDEAVMVWDNGVTTTGLWLGEPLPEPIAEEEV